MRAHYRNLTRPAARDQAPAIVGQVLAAAVVITRVMALPAVEAFLK